MLWKPRFETEHRCETGEVQWKAYGRPQTRLLYSNVDQAILVETHKVATLLRLGPEALHSGQVTATPTNAHPILRGRIGCKELRLPNTAEAGPDERCEDTEEGQLAQDCHWDVTDHVCGLNTRKPVT